MGNILSYNNRLDYGRVLMPDDGWTTSWAIGTTYGLNLEVLMTVPLALFHGKYLSEKTDLCNLKADMLDALNKVRDRMFVFVHENNFSAKCRFSKLMSFLDQNIYNVRPERENSRFHPKIWLVRYERGEEYKYRLVAMSRNITTATDFDIAVKLDGHSKSNKGKANDALIGIMKYLVKHSANDEALKVIEKQIKEELPKVCFEAPSPFTKAVFGPHKFNDPDIKKSWSCPLCEQFKCEEFKCEQLMVISPFVDKDTLEMLRGRLKEGVQPVLVSRENELDKIVPSELEKWDCYQWNSVLEEAADYEEMESDEVMDPNISRSISLHAKIYIIKAKMKSQRCSQNNWFVGSTNCTNAGFERNVEALVHLASKDDATSVDSVFKSLEPLITKYAVKTQPDVANDDSEKMLREIVSYLSTLEIKTKLVDCGNKYSLTLYVDDEAPNGSKELLCKLHNDKVKVCISLFSTNGCWNPIQDKSCTFEVQCQELSPFVKVEVEYRGLTKEFLMKIPLEIPEERNALIMSEILDSEDKIMRYLMFCLDSNMDEGDLRIGSQVSRNSNAGGDENSMSEYSMPIYERLLLASSRKPQLLADIDKSIKQLENSCNSSLSKEFREFWSLFETFANAGLKKKRDNKTNFAR